MSIPIEHTELQLLHASKVYQELVEFVKKAHRDSDSIDKLEAGLVGQLMTFGLAILRDFVDAAGNGDHGEQLTVEDQTVQRSQQQQQRKYRSVFGELTINRYVYSRRQKTKAIVKPLDEKLGLPADEISYVLESWLGNLSVDVPFSVAANWLKSTLGIEVKSSMAHRRLDKLGEHVEEFNQQRETMPLEEEQAILVALADGKGVPVRTPFAQRVEEELGIKPCKRLDPQKNYPKSRYRHVLGDKKSQRATAGAFYSIAAQRRTPQDVLQGRSQSAATVTNKRLWAELNFIAEDQVSRGAERVFEALAEEQALRDPENKKTLVCLMDGDRHLWSLRQEYLPAAVEILDLYHVMEKLWLAAHCFHQEASLEAEQWVHRHLEMLLENKVDSVRGLLKRAINRQDLSPTKLKQLESVYNYFTTNRDRMQYGTYIAKGYPIGSGVIEGACKHVIGDRLCGTGMTWEYEGAQRMLDLRVTKLNGEWDKFIEYRIRTEQQQLYQTAA